MKTNVLEILCGIKIRLWWEDNLKLDLGNSILLLLSVGAGDDEF
jgi:hypothetical protein